MNKEQIITVVIGLAVGALAVAGYLAAKNFLPALKPPAAAVTTQAPQTLPKALATTLPLTLNLADHSSTKAAQLEILGQTAPGAAVFVLANADEKIASADGQGNFTSSLKLEDGENELSVTALSQGSNPVTVHRNITLEINP